MPSTKKKVQTKSNTVKLKFDTSWSYAPAPESKSAATINKQYDLFINGEWQKPSSQKILIPSTTTGGGWRWPMQIQWMLMGGEGGKKCL
jgi:hypothetical protein